MAESTTLETLVLEIDSSAQKANEGITNLINPLRSLARAVGTVVPALRAMKTELREISRLKIPNIGSAISSGARGAKKTLTTEEIRAWQAQGKPTFRYFADSSSMLSDAELRKLHPEWYTTEQQRAANAIANAQNGGQASWAGETQKAVTGYNQMIGAQGKVASSARSMSKAVSAAKVEVRAVGKAADESKPKMSGFAKNMQMVGRIFKTMLIRTLIRNLIKAFGESWNAAYEFSRQMGGTFANSVDAARTLLYDLGTTVVQTVAPVFEALVPIIKVVVDAISYMCQGIQSLLRLLGMTSDVTGAATSKINKYINSAGKGGKATKNMLASWDQLNVIQSKGSSGSGAAYKPGALSKLVNAETNAITQMFVGETLLALGLILACTGHIGVGIGMMAVGGAAIAKTLIEDWGKLPKNIQDTISKIMVIAGTSMLALGVIVACSGNLPLGIGMIAAGVANLGIAVGLNWDSIVDTVNGVMTDIGQWFVARWNDIKNAVSNAWNAVSKWWTENIATPIANAWGSVKTFFKDMWGSAEEGTGIAGWASNAWNDVKSWWETNVVENMEKEGAWGGVKGFFKGLWDTVGTYANDAWNIGNNWLDENIGVSFRSIWGDVTNVFKDIFGTTEQPDTIVGMIHGAWQDVSEWWTTNVSDKMKDEGVWGGVKGFFQGIFTGEEGNGGILGFFNTMWDGISKFWKDNVTKPIKTAWENIATWFHTNVTQPISDFFINMVNRLIDGLNWLIDCLNTVGHISWGGIDLGILGKIPGFDAKIFEIPKIEYVAFGANGLYDVPKGDLFVANEAGAELVGSMNGKTTVANQMQIIEGIQKGVRDANEDQNVLLRQQNELLRALLQKNNTVTPSAAWGAFAQRSIDMWDGMTGG